MSKLSGYLLLTLMLILNSSCNTSLSAEQRDEAITTLKEFYTKYMTACAKWPTSQKELEAIKLQYLTPKLLNQLSQEEWDYDPIVSYSPGQRYENVVIKLLVVKYETDYKIDSIL